MSDVPLTLLAFDYGEKRIGVAVGQTLTRSATPLTTINVRNLVPDWPAIEKLLKQWHPDALIVGKPLNMDGTEQLASKRAARFGNQLRGRFGLPVHTCDERLTTREAYARMEPGMNPKEHADPIAAQVILEGWLSQSQVPQDV